MAVTSTETPQVVKTTDRGKNAFRLMNAVMRAIMRSPFHGMVSRWLMLVTFTGRKSGKEFTTPVSYFRIGGALVFFTRHAWWRNLVDEPEVVIRLRGRDVPCTAEVHDYPGDVTEAAMRFIRERGAKNAWQIGLQLKGKHEPSFEEVKEASQGTVLVRLRPRRAR